MDEFYWMKIPGTQQTTDPEVLLPLLRALKLLVLHGDALGQAALKWPAHVDHFLRKYIMPRCVLVRFLTYILTYSYPYS